MPSSLPSVSTTVVSPSRLRVISKSTSFIGVSGETRGMSSPVCIRSSTRSSCLPSRPPGWSTAKSSTVKPRRSRSAMLSASPIASAAVVEAVGARPSGHASVRIETSRCTSAACASGERGLPVSATSGADEALQPGHEAQDLLGVAAVRDGEQHVALDDAAEVAVDRLGRMQEERGRAGRREGGRDLLGDDPALAHAGGDHAPRAGEERLDRALEALVEPRDQLADGVGLDLEHLAGGIQRHAPHPSGKPRGRASRPCCVAGSPQDAGGMAGGRRGTTARDRALGPVTRSLGRNACGLPSHSGGRPGGRTTWLMQARSSRSARSAGGEAGS